MKYREKEIYSEDAMMKLKKQNKLKENKVEKKVENI